MHEHATRPASSHLEENRLELLIFVGATGGVTEARVVYTSFAGEDDSALDDCVTALFEDLSFPALGTGHEYAFTDTVRWSERRLPEPEAASPRTSQPPTIRRGFDHWTEADSLRGIDAERAAQAIEPHIDAIEECFASEVRRASDGVRVRMHLAFADGAATPTVTTVESEGGGLFLESCLRHALEHTEAPASLSEGAIELDHTFTYRTP